MKVNGFSDCDASDVRDLRYFSVARCACMTCATDSGVQFPPNARDV